MEVKSLTLVTNLLDTVAKKKVVRLVHLEVEMPFTKIRKGKNWFAKGKR